MPGGDYRDALRERAAAGRPSPGRSSTPTAARSGSTAARPAYTVGQRQGLGVALGEPRYVSRIDPLSNTIQLGRREDLEIAHVRRSSGRRSSARTPPAVAVPGRASASAIARRPSRRPSDRWATRRPPLDRSRPTSPVWAAAPGQAAVLYDGDVVLGGGRIERPSPAGPAATAGDESRAARPQRDRLSVEPALVLSVLVGTFHAALSVLIRGSAGGRLPLLVVAAILGAWAGDALGGSAGHRLRSASATSTWSGRRSWPGWASAIVSVLAVLGPGARAAGTVRSGGPSRHAPSDRDRSAAFLRGLTIGAARRRGHRRLAAVGPLPAPTEAGRRWAVRPGVDRESSSSADGRAVPARSATIAADVDPAVTTAIRGSQALPAAEIRRRFLEYFAERGHTIVPSASLVPAGDQTLLFTNSGMVQFKDALTGAEQRDYTRAVDYQRCLRVAGKHNDFEEVGRTPRHHTLFEMLGNWSFGDYFKREAIHWAWDFLTRDLGIPGERLAATTYTTDDTRLRRLARRDRPAAGAARALGRLPGRRREELVADGRHRPVRPVQRDPLRPRRAPQRGPALRPRPRRALPALARDLEPRVHGVRAPPGPVADAAARARASTPGMGLERLASVLQQVPTNYDTDLFPPIHARMRELLGHDPDAFEAERFSYQVIADHSRAVTFLIADDVLPSNEGRGYVLRRILRRAVRHGRLLGRREPFMAETAAVVIEVMGEAYPHLVDAPRRDPGRHRPRGGPVRADPRCRHGPARGGAHPADRRGAASSAVAPRTCRPMPRRSTARSRSSSTTPTASRST